MGPKEAAVALELLGVGRCVPCHYGTFPLLTGTPEACREALTTDCEIVGISPGDTYDL
jgi:L-ascorbate metabolism protein UlaG (beta-lactamase superfamily)